jgi:hypothetical protein
MLTLWGKGGYNTEGAPTWRQGKVYQHDPREKQDLRRRTEIIPVKKIFPHQNSAVGFETCVRWGMAVTCDRYKFVRNSFTSEAAI